MFDLSFKILFFLQKYNLLDAKWKNFDFNRTKIERKFRENEVENFVENTSKFAKILNEDERISFVHFREIRSTKIWIETRNKGLYKINLLS